MLKIRSSKIVAAVLAAGFLLGAGFFLGFQSGREVPLHITVSGIKNISSDQNAVDFSTFWQAWQIITDEYLKNNEVKDQSKVYGAINGLVNSLGDPHSNFFTPEDSKKFQEDIRGNFSGIGAEIGIKKNQLVIIAPLGGSPAGRAGLRPGDGILKIDGQATDGLSVDQAVNSIRGETGTVVKLKILREGWDKPKDFSITRENIVVPTVELTMIGDIAHIKLRSFNANTNLLFYEKMLSALSSGAKGLVLDLRDDPGGFLQVAVDMSGWFLKRDTLVVTESSRISPPKDYRAYGNAALSDFPVVVLINGGSASASEILAGTLRDNRGVKLVGEQSFGKGTVQELRDLKDGSSMKITIAHWVLPSGLILEGAGLKPDFETKLTDDDIKAGKDPQLDKATEVLKSEILSTKS